MLMCFASSPRCPAYHLWAWLATRNHRCESSRSVEIRGRDVHSALFTATPAGAVLLIVAVMLVPATVRPARAQVGAGPSGVLISATNCSQPGGQPAPPNFASAVKVFGTEDQPQTIPLFSEIIDGLRARDARRTVVETAVLACSLSYRAEIRLNLGQPDQADQDLRTLCAVAPSFVIDQRFMSRRLVDRFNQICQVAWLTITVSPRDAQVTVDDVLVDVSNPVVVKPGVHQVALRRGEQTVRQQVEVGRGATQVVQIEVRRGRLSLVPFTLGLIGAGGTLAMALVEDDKLKKAVAERQLPRSDLEPIQERRDTWRRASIATASFSVAYLVLRQAIGSPANESNVRVSVEPSTRGVHLVWRLAGR